MMIYVLARECSNAPDVCDVYVKINGQLHNVSHILIDDDGDLIITPEEDPI